MAFVGSAIPVILLLCMGNIILVLVIIFMCIKMNKIKTTLSDSRREFTLKSSVCAYAMHGLFKL